MAIDDQQPDQRDTPDTPGAPDDKKAATFPVRARMVLRVPPVWIFPLCIPAVLITVMTLIYIGSVLNPAAHLHGLPVMVVNQDSGAEVGGHHVDEGETVVNALTHTTAVSSRLGLRVTSLKEAEAVMNRGGAYATVVIPPTFTDSLRDAAAGAPTTTSSVPARPAVQLLENARPAVSESASPPASSPRHFIPSRPMSARTSSHRAPRPPGQRPTPPHSSAIRSPSRRRATVHSRPIPRSD